MHKQKQKYRVLLSESNTGERAMVKLYLNSLSIDCFTFESNEGLRHFFNTINSKEEGYNVVQLDTHLDGLSGLTMAIEIRKKNPD